ncbi:MAG: hypothetical protein R3B07_10155 [Polyangiaceae bacterium]
MIFGAGFWFSSSSQFSLMLPLMSLMIAGVVWFYMSGGLKRTHRRARVSDRTRVRVEDTTSEPFEDTAEDISSRNRQRR